MLITTSVNSVTETVFRTEASTEADERLLWGADAAIIQDIQSSIADVPPEKCKNALSVAPGGCATLERLVELRFSHQTQRAVNSVRSRGESKTQGPRDTQVTTTTAAKQQKLCVQMADVIRRSGTGLERSTRWKSAPGTMDASEVSGLSGNSANAEIVARDRVGIVSDSRPSHDHPVHLGFCNFHTCTGTRVAKQNFYLSLQRSKPPRRWSGWSYFPKN